MTPLESAGERFAAIVLLAHLAWFLLFFTATIVSARSFCGGNDDCDGLWLFIWGMPWMLGELLFVVPAIVATLKLLSGLRRGAVKVPLLGLSTLAAIPLVVIVADIALI